MSWNYRVIDESTAEETWYTITEVYYDKEGKPNGSSTKSLVSAGSLEELRWALNKMLEALDKPVLKETDF